MQGQNYYKKIGEQNKPRIILSFLSTIIIIQVVLVSLVSVLGIVGIYFWYHHYSVLILIVLGLDTADTVFDRGNPLCSF